MTNYGVNALYRNNGDGTFTDRAKAAGVTVGVGSSGDWIMCAAFGDGDGDGDLDLFVGRYVIFGPEVRPICLFNKIWLACPPLYYQGQSSFLFRNNGDGTFTDVTKASGVFNGMGKALGALWTDYDDDGRLDLLVANDGVARNLYHNRGGGRFRDVASAVGAAFDPAGGVEGAMGVDSGDYDRDGDLDFFITNFQDQSNALLRNDGTLFSYQSAPAVLHAPSRLLVSFGTGFLDYENDGDLDLFVASGHVQDAIQQVDRRYTFAQPRQLFRNRGDCTFEDISDACVRPVRRRWWVGACAWRIMTTMATWTSASVTAGVRRCCCGTRSGVATRGCGCVWQGGRPMRCDRRARGVDPVRRILEADRGNPRRE